MRRYVIILLALLALHSPALARINVVTLPERDSVLLTIYNSVDLTLVKEVRTLTLRKGLNRLEFSWANTLIDPTSVELLPLTHAADIEVVDVSFPARIPNTLEWRIQSEHAGEAQVEIRYFTSGISWAADYVLEASRQENVADLAGYVRVTNQSGEDYENAQFRLVVGVIRLVEDIAGIARKAGAKFMTDALKDNEAVRERLYFEYKEAESRFAQNEPMKRKQMVKESLSEYYLYTVAGKDTVPNGWSRRMQSFQTNNVPITSYYKYEKEAWGDSVKRFYRFKNDVASRLGQEPLPEGRVVALRLKNEEGIHGFTGQTSVKYVPVDEQVDLELGTDAEVRVAAELVNWVKKDMQFDSDGNVAGWTTIETWEIDVQNSRDIDVLVDIRRSFGGDWTLRTDAAHEKVDAGKVKFLAPLKAREKGAIRYEVETRHGTNASR